MKLLNAEELLEVARVHCSDATCDEFEKRFCEVLDNLARDVDAATGAHFASPAAADFGGILVGFTEGEQGQRPAEIGAKDPSGEWV